MHFIQTQVKVDMFLVYQRNIYVVKVYNITNTKKTKMGAFQITSWKWPYRRKVFLCSQSQTHNIPNVVHTLTLTTSIPNRNTHPNH